LPEIKTLFLGATTILLGALRKRPVADNIISIFGTSNAQPGEPVYDLAYNMGRVLVASGWAIANGGYGGTMLAAAQGASEAGGRVYGVTCTAFNRGRANAFVTNEIVTHSLEERLKTLVEMGQGYVVLPGGTGTLLELATVWEFMNKGFLQKRPVIVLTSFWEPLLTMISKQDVASLSLVHTAQDPETARDLLSDHLIKE
jgi:uncharacterized protein (TIGR00730 family)